MELGKGVVLESYVQSGEEVARGAENFGQVEGSGPTPTKRLIPRHRCLLMILNT